MKQSNILLFLALMIFGCANSNSQTDQPTRDQFTWNIQKAGYDFNRYDEMGVTDLESFLTEFEQFPWLDQLDFFQAKQEGCSPTLSVKDLQSKKDFWVSMAGDRNDHIYLIGYIYPKEKNGLLGQTKTVRWLEIYLTEDSQVVKDCFKLFFQKQHNELETKIRKLEEYAQMEAKN